MYIVEINSVKYGSTGSIAKKLSEKVIASGGNSVVCVPRGRHNGYLPKDKNVHLFGFPLSEDIHIILGRLTGKQGCFSYFATLSLIRFFNKKKPDLIHLHNLHNSYINIPLLIRYINKNHIPVVWTFHDCWAFTGHCPYFEIAKCYKWKNGCFQCPSFRSYPQSLIDNSEIMWKKKKEWFTGIKNMTVVTPSKWLAELTWQSYFKDYPVKVINNGIDLSVFKPAPSNFRNQYGIKHNKYIILGVAFGWGERKGLDVFVELSGKLDFEKYQIVLVGTTEKIDKLLPNTIISIHKTQNQQELAEIYTASDLFLNPTRDEVFGLVNAEALACGTSVLTFRTGGCPEIISRDTGSVVNCDDIDVMENEIIRICETKPYMAKDCIEQAKKFDLNDKFQEYIDLYRRIYDGTAKS